MRFARTYVLAFFFLLLAFPVFAQLPSAGDMTSPPTPGAGHDYIHSPAETVNPANGSVSVRIPLRVPSGRELTIPISVAYDSAGAYYYGGQGPGYTTITNGVLAKGGWSYTFPLLTHSQQNWTATNGVKNFTCEEGINYVFQDPTGNRHNLGLAPIKSYAGFTCNGTGPAILQGGEGPILATTTNTLGACCAPVTVTDGNGTLYSFGGQAQVLPTSITDRNGNTVSMSYTVTPTQSATVTDTVGRTAISVGTFGANPDSITVAGLSSPYKAYWTTAPASFTITATNLPSFLNTPCPTSMTGNASVISRVTLPNGQNFTFNYDSTYGMLNKITYPTGGYIRYVWGLNSQAQYFSAAVDDSNGNTAASYSCTIDFPAVTDRYVSLDGTTELLHQHFSYSTSWTSGTGQYTGKTTTVTTTDLARNTSFTTVYSYSPILQPCVPDLNPNANDDGCVGNNDTMQMPVEQCIEYYDATGSGGAPPSTCPHVNPPGRLLRNVIKSWNKGDPRTLGSEQTVLDNGQSSLTINCYNTSEQLTESDSYDLGTTTIAPPSCSNGVPSGTAAGTLLRKTTKTYATFTGTNIVDLPSSVITYDGSGNRLAETDSSYDQSGLQSTSVVQHGAAGTARGNLTTVTKQCFALPGGQACPQGNSTTTYAYYDTGQIYQQTDPKGNTTTYSYSDSYTSCGGSAPPSGSTNAYLTQVNYPQTNGVNHIESHCYDYSSGLLFSSTDQSNLVTSYKYNDILDRLTEIDSPDGGVTTYSYNDTPPTPTFTTSKKINSSGLTETTVAISNGLGLTKQTQLTSDPQGTIYTDTTYDGLGRAYTVSNPYRTGSDPTTSSGTTTFVYDALARKTSETESDGSVITTAYCGPSTLVTDPTGRWRRSRVDGFGHLAEVDEPNAIGATVNSSGCPGTGEPIWVTNYTVNALGGLTQIVQNGSHQRSFTFDSLSRLLTSTNPEVGTITYAYDANGNVASKTSPAANQDGYPGTGSATVSGSEQSIAGAPATSGTGSVTFSGTLQSKQVVSQPATSGTGSVTVSGSLQSKQVLTHAATSGSGWVAINGSEQSTQVCRRWATGGDCLQWVTVYDHGTVSITVNGVLSSVSYGQNDTPSSIATNLANAINANTSINSLVSASASSATVTITATQTGSQTNYSLSSTSATGDTKDFGGPSFGTTQSGSTLTGGANASYTTVYDSGTTTITVNGHSDSASWSGSGTTSSSIASALASSINGDSGASVTASASGGTVNLTAKTAGASTNYSLSSSWTYDSSDFSSSSFTTSNSGSTLTGGKDAVYNTLYDSGTSTITVNGHADTVSWSGSGTTTSTIASALVSAINADSGAYVSASVSGSTVNLTAKATGASTNYSLSSSNTYDSSDFSSASFSSSNSGSTLTGGHDAGATTYDSGNVWVTINGTQYSVGYGQNSSSSSLASALASTISAGSLANASANGSTVSITAKTVGSATNYSLSSGSSTSQPGSFSSPSFSASVSGPSLTGGADPGATTVTTTYSYDGLNRAIGRSYSNGDPSVSITYDQSNCLGLAQCQNIGQRTSMSDAAGSEGWAYDVPDRIRKEQRTTSGVTKPTTYNLDYAGNLTSFVYPTGRTVKYTYDAADRPQTAADGSNGITYGTDFETAPAGCLSGAVCYTPQGTFYALSIGQTSSFTGLNLMHIYNSRLQPQEFKASSTGGNAIDITYSFIDSVTGHNAGHVNSITNNLDGTRSQAFSYDQLNRLTSAWTTSTYSSSPAHCWAESFNLDAWGNLNSIAATSNSAYNGCYLESGFSALADVNNHTPMWSYDAAGNATADGFTTYAWDAESQLKSAAGVNYQYDGDGRRVAKVGSKLYWYGSGGDILAETDANGNTTAEYIFFGGKRVAMLPAGGNPVYYVEDLLGTSRVLTNNSGVVCYDADFYPYGGERAYTNTCSQNYKFEGKERDTETGNDDFGARYYSNRFGRWLSADWSSVPVPVPYANLTNPQTLNLYAMVADDPESFADLDGHECYISAPGGISCKGEYRISVGNTEGEGSSSSSNSGTAGQGSSQDTQAQAQAQADQNVHQQGQCTNASCGDQAPQTPWQRFHERHPNWSYAEYQLLVEIVTTLPGPAEISATGKAAKAANLPAWKSIGIDMEHILSGHTEGGARAAQSGIKSLFPKEWSAKQIERAVREAYRYGTKAGGIEGGRVLMEGTGGGRTIRMYLNIAEKLIESAWPK